ncbi:DegT/DnrJ/EryC1/StrS family aminotransferase [Candidatus Woesearchaeota archaeon]|nr:DegT/DnrJ/EryC1/StrS family aminotransferase [Candidatus Woesearchaeota archaeon]
MIPLSRPTIGKEEINSVVKVLKSGILSLGPKLEEFEEKFSRLMGSKYAIAVNSGTSGLHLALKSLGINPGDEVITTPFSFVASANCALFENAKPVFVDVEEDTFNINPDLIKEKINAKTRFILPVHVFGQSCDMDPILKAARENKLKVVEDACESILATYKGKNTGTMGDAGVFAFYPNKQMTTAEGGMIVTNYEKTSALCKSYRNQGRSDNMQWLTHQRIGYNYRMDEINAAIGVEQLEKLPGFIKKRKELANAYLDELKGIDGVTLPKIRKGNEHSWFVFPVMVSEKIRDRAISELNAMGIQSKAYFHPCIHLQPFYRESLGCKEGDFPVAEKLSRTIMILPFYEQIKEKDMHTVVNSLKKILRRLK